MTLKTTATPVSNIAQRRAQARKSADEEYCERRNKLLKAAVRVFRQEGYKGASLNAIAREVGIDRASVYYYTSGKEELFHEVVRDATLENVLMAEAVAQSETSPRQRIEAFIISLMRSYEVHYPYLYVYVQEDMAQITGKQTEWAKEMRRLTKRFDTAATSLVQAGLDDGSFRDDLGSAQLIAFGIIGMCNWSHRWYRPTGKLSSDAIGRSFAGIVLGGIVRGGLKA